MDTAILISEVKNGSMGAARCLYERYAPDMLNTCRRMVRVLEDAEELMLDGFHSFFMTIGSFRYIDDAGLYGWLERIMINVCLDSLTKKTSFEMVALEEAADFAVDEEAHARLSAEEILQLITDLPVGCRTVLSLYCLHNIPHREIASMLNITESTSKSQYAHAKKLLQKKLPDLNKNNEQRK